MKLRRLRVEREGAVYEGYEMPKPKSGPEAGGAGKAGAGVEGPGMEDILVLKLDNGYNISVKSDKKTKITVLGEMEVNPPKTSSEKHEWKGKGGDDKWAAILGCGGTIGSRVEYTTGAVYPFVSAEELASQFPDVKDIANIRTENVFSILSEDMTPSHWAVIAKKAYDTIKDGAEGVVITHGTDTMHYTSAALSFIIQDLPVPIILTGAQRSSDRGSSDTKMNLLSSISVARSSDLAEVAVCMHGSVNDDYNLVHRGTKVRKLHSSRRDAFKSVNASPLGKVNARDYSFAPISSYVKRGKHKIKDIKFDDRLNENAAMVYMYPGIKPKAIDRLSEYDGVVLVGTGLGHVSTNPFGDKLAASVIDNVRNLIESDIPVVMTTQAIGGRVNMNVYTAGRLLKDIGVIGNLCDWTPETAYVKLCWVLGHAKGCDKVKQEMETNLVGEITERITAGADEYAPDNAFYGKE